ncbi:uncharacterized protein [Diadema antillarum]|uniref:uncharacterized protein n=1 Tax=Diadema antillarum TaxID=105358 RepID=UPI003A85DFD5
MGSMIIDIMSFGVEKPVFGTEPPVSSNSDSGPEEAANMEPKRKRLRSRGKRKRVRRKEHRRRVRPGRSRRGGYVRIGAPLNDNAYLLSQRFLAYGPASENIHNADGCLNFTASSTVTYVPSDSPYMGQGPEMREFSGRISTSPERCCEMPRRACDISVSGASEGDTSDYGTGGSVNSPVGGGGVFSCSYLHDEQQIGSEAGDHFGDSTCSSHGLFDETFAQKNFEADYSAQEQVLRSELTGLPRRELEERCTMLMDRVKELEETRRMEELKQEMEELLEENRHLREENGQLSKSKAERSDGDSVHL